MMNNEHNRRLDRCPEETSNLAGGDQRLINEMLSTYFRTF